MVTAQACKKLALWHHKYPLLSQAAIEDDVYDFEVKGKVRW